MNWLLLLLLFIASPAWGYKFASGSYTGNSADNRDIVIASTTSPSVTSFQPDAVFINCDTASGDLVVSTRDMIAQLGDGAVTPRNGSALLTNVVQAFNATGFQVGSDNLTNATGVTCYYMAIADNGGDVAVGHYTSDAADNRTIDISSTSLGGIADFSPEFVMTINTVSFASLWHTPAMGGGGDLSCYFTVFACIANAIQSVNANGFVIGDNVGVNDGSSDVYFYIAIKAVSGSTSAGTYTGNANGDGITNDNRAVTLPGFLPQFLLIKGDSASRNAAQRYKDNAGDSSFGTSAVTTTDRIQQFLSNGFEVGTALSANESGVTQYYYALKSVPAAPTTVRRHRPVVIQ